MIDIKTTNEIELIAEGGKILASVLKRLSEEARPGITTLYLDNIAKKMIFDAGAEPAFLGYKPSWNGKPFPAAICSSVNQIIVHGVPSEYILRQGDVLKIDCGVKYKGFYSDSAITVGIGKISKNAEKLIGATKLALERAAKSTIIGNTIGDIGYIISKTAYENKFSPAELLTGHGVGRNLHEYPNVPNVGRPGCGEKLDEGVVIAIEPMFIEGSGRIKELGDGSFTSVDGSLTAHFEHTVAVTKNGPQILTAME